MSDARIVLTIDYEPNLDHYPDHITTKRDAMEFDVQQVLDGNVSDEDLFSAADCLDWEVVDR
ncbi:hypothetical protein J4U02_gp096 [Mycobacterium phage Aziz]|uniref:Uncharacterized protein n=1 Tax=Mycobacterium phage Aziz TaxID=2762281 RepID=A0A7G8LHN4_9CAUD|nr:hypothetical protein J4U02_gp096 [Mycobacterium phage Aziz]ASR75944.1 hypothetical protein SEA_GENEVAB15_98 [Mycobacterium phage GenevaB15]QNJ56756.1 hypothetical protein SEA_AZIZ_96 [Mycobacterium phage Aziz]